MPTYFTVNPESQKGSVYATDFIYTADFPAEYTQFTWDLGNGLFEYNTPSVTASYGFPGVYKVGLSAWTNEGFLLTDQTDVDVDYIFRDVLLFTQLPSAYGTPSIKSDSPFTIQLTSAKIDQPLSIVLQAFNTNSVPHYAVPQKWEFLVPRWRFVDASNDQVLDGPIQLNTTPIIVNGKTVAMAASASFYYIDDLASGGGCPLLLAATLSTERFTYPPESLRYPYYSYSNSEVARAVISWQINDAIPTKLKVTENYLSDIYPIKWSNVPIPVMITCEFDPTLLDEFGNSKTETSKVLSYPRTNELGEIYKVKLVLSAEGGSLIPEDYYTVEVDGTSYNSSDAPLYFKAFDEQNNTTSGYIFTTVTPLSPLSSSVVVAVSTVAANADAGGATSAFAFPDGFPIYSNVYVSHPAESTINRIDIVTYSSTICGNIQYYKDLGILVEGSASFIPVPTLTSADLTNYQLSGTANVYGMAFDPIQNKLYAADADQDMLYVLNGGLGINQTIPISSYTGDTYNVPSHISIDRFSNIWISLYSKEVLLKLSPSLNLLLSATPSTTLGLSAEGSYLVSPPIVETDSQNNVWACYSHTMSSALIKFDGSTGTELFRASPFPLSSVPIALAINPDNNVWVACRDSNKLQLHSGTDGTLIKTIEGFLKPSYIMLDRANNIWVTHGHNFLSVYNTSNDTVIHYKFYGETKSFDTVSGYTSADTHLAYYEDEIWGGLTVDVFERVWVVDSEQNVLFVFKTTDVAGSLNTYDLLPAANTNYVVIGGTNYITALPQDKVKSAQAGGDWSGNRWYQKYSGAYSSLPVRGTSTPFNVYDLNNSFNIAKVNEEFDCAEYFRSLALPEILHENPVLFEEFLEAVVGNGVVSKEDIGRVAYERIANFVQTHGDFETAEITQLMSFADQLSVPFNKYGADFPTEVNRLLNLFSVPKHRLRGQVVYETDLNKNIGPLLTETSLVTAEQYIFAKDRFYEKYQLVYVAPLSSGNILVDIQNEQNISTFDNMSIELPSENFLYPLSLIQVEGLRTPLSDNYYFFQYNAEQIGYKGNIINWDSDFTTVDYTLSSYEEWYGDEGLVETMFNNILTKRLISDN